MKLLFDQNLSFRLVEAVAEAFPGSAQVRLLGLEQASDREIWDYARENGFVVVTKDSDFHELCVLYGPPPKIIWLKIGNASTQVVKDGLLKNADELKAALMCEDVYYLELY